MKSRREETICVDININKDDLDAAMSLILVKDLLKALRTAVKDYSTPARDFVRDAMKRGFDRASVRHSIGSAELEFSGALDIAERNLGRVEAINPAMAGILKTDLESVRNMIGSIMKSTEELIAELPDIEKQMLSEKGGASQ